MLPSPWTASDEAVSHDVDALVLFRPLRWENPLADGDFVLPTGTVTFLLGDVEGSTRGWQADADGMAVAISDLSAVVDDVVGRFDGVRPLEQGEGDSFV